TLCSSDGRRLGCSLMGVGAGVGANCDDAPALPLIIPATCSAYALSIFFSSQFTPVTSFRVTEHVALASAPIVDSRFGSNASPFSDRTVADFPARPGPVIMILPRFNDD